ncbi:KPN_02809 family neutral zinc metallopeptidase [Sphingosinicella terrae]|uniref:KPN_02809 family neutral zinc metallopeptidase n=1 Tax=Sphingosinicella terrae TaxID=2172047 RepID=UPI000E0D7680|nr:neutral zinc metallopeptidase [Sphingosinicella terrae]
MRLGDERPSGNFEDRSGRGGFRGFGGGGGGAFGLIAGLVLNRFGIVGLLVLLLGYCALTMVGGGGDGGTGAGGFQPAREGSPEAASTVDPQTRDMVLRVLGSTERRWTDLFGAQGAQYQPTTLVFYARTDRSGCGVAQSAMGPFYCPSDQRIYLDATFFQELSSQYGAAGDFAQAYVIAHEVGHHIQNLTGTLDAARRRQSGASEAAANRVQVGVELQADCLAGVWAANDRNLMEEGDLEEGMNAAAAIGDDALQRAGQGRVVPESFTHGSSAQRQEALLRGYRGANPAACDAYTADL